MRILVTAGNTAVPIDKVRQINNIFKGRTGIALAKYMADQGHDVTLLTSTWPTEEDRGRMERVLSYRTFDDLATAMEVEIKNGNYDVVVHSAAVSDYRVEGVYVDEGHPVAKAVGLHTPITKISAPGANTKISSSNKELWLRLVQTPKLIDQIRNPWGFKGVLVKFKLQVGLTDAELKRVAEKSMLDSDADIIVANCLEWSAAKALIFARDFVWLEVARRRLPEKLQEVVDYEFQRKKVAQ